MVFPSIRDWILIFTYVKMTTCTSAQSLQRSVARDQSVERRILYLTETRTESNVTYKRSWQTDEVQTVLADCNAGNTLTVIYAGSREGFFSGA
jgi:hypothetical protein